MNATLELLHAHRSIRRFRADPVPEEHLREAVRAGQMASTSSAVQAYCAIQVRDAATRERLVELTGNQPKVAACGAFLVICGDVRRHRLAAARDGHAYEPAFEAFLVSVIDATLFAQNLCVALEAMGYGICCIGGLRNHLFEVDRLLEIPHGVYPLFGLCAGISDEAPSPRPRLPVESVLFDERYPDDATILAHMDEYDEVYAEYMGARSGATKPAPRNWSATMGVKYVAPERADVAEYYRSKGARLE